MEKEINVNRKASLDKSITSKNSEKFPFRWKAFSAMENFRRGSKFSRHWKILSAVKSFMLAKSL